MGRIETRQGYLAQLAVKIMPMILQSKTENSPGIDWNSDKTYNGARKELQSTSGSSVSSVV